MKKTLLLLLLLPGLACAEPNPPEATAREMEQYKIAMDRSCRDAGARKGMPQERINLVCDCAMQALNSKRTSADWQQSFNRFRANDRKAEQQSLKEVEADVKVCVTIARQAKQLVPDKSGEAAPVPSP